MHTRSLIRRDLCSTEVTAIKQPHTDFVVYQFQRQGAVEKKSAACKSVQNDRAGKAHDNQSINQFIFTVLRTPQGGQQTMSVMN